MKKYIIYKTTNNINKKFYIGYHSTEDIDDDYLGSGRDLLKAIKKYGKDNFTKEILFIFNNLEDALEMEKIIVNESVVKDKQSYNIKVGGEGGWSHIPKMLKEDSKFKNKFSKAVAKSMKMQYKNGSRKGWKHVNDNPKYRGCGFLGKKHTEESKKKISKNNRMILDKKVIEDRLNDYNNIEKKWGYIKKLSEKWGVSHTQVRRFINKYGI